MKRWYPFTGFQDGVITERLELQQFEVRWKLNDVLVSVHPTLAEAEAVQDRFGEFAGTVFSEYKIVEVESFAPIAKDTQLLVPIFPLPIFDAGGTILATRGFWDASVTLQGGTAQQVVAFAMGIRLFPRGVLLNRSVDDDIETETWNESAAMPNILTQDTDCFVYESFARLIRTQALNDPPFYSKAKRKIPPNSALGVIVGVSLQDTQGLTSVRLAFGSTFRVLVET